MNKNTMKIVYLLKQVKYSKYGQKVSKDVQEEMEKELEPDSTLGALLKLKTQSTAISLL